MGTGRWIVAFVLVLSAPLGILGCGESDSREWTPGEKAGDLGFYDWSANLLGPGKVMNPFTGVKGGQVEQVLRSQAQKWTDAGRPVTEDLNRFFINSGAEPTRDDAGKVAAAAEAEGEAPQGAIVVTETPTAADGSIVRGVRYQGYYALNDDPALTGRDLTDLAVGHDENGRPVVTFQFTEKGQAAFEQITRNAAKRGPTGPCDGSGVCRAIYLPDSIAIIYRNRVLDRPTIDFRQHPKGLDGEAGFRIRGFESDESAQDLIDSLSAN